MSGEGGGYRLGAKLPGERDWIVGAREDRSIESVKEQIRRVAPEWRKVFGEELELAPVEEGSEA